MGATRFIGACWVAWALLWLVLALDTKQTARRESWASRARHGAPIVIGALLLVASTRIPTLDRRLLPHPPGGLAIVLVLAGFATAIWARLTIGGNWSGTVTLKQQHELVRTGPYAWVRHPIYSGLLLALLGTVLVLDALLGVLGFALVLFAFLRKIRIEESFMEAAFGDAYRDYRRITPAIVPRFARPPRDT